MSEQRRPHAGACTCRRRSPTTSSSPVELRGAPVQHNSEFRIAVLPGDGIGEEIREICHRRARRRAREDRRIFPSTTSTCPAARPCTGKPARHFRRRTFDARGKPMRSFSAPWGCPDVRQPDGTEPAPQLDLRFGYELYAGVRPIKAFPGTPLALRDPRASDIDLVIIRESTEGLFASRGRGVVEDDAIARDTMVITRSVLRASVRFLLRARETAKKPRT